MRFRLLIRGAADDGEADPADGLEAAEREEDPCTRAGEVEKEVEIGSFAPELCPWLSVLK